MLDELIKTMDYGVSYGSGTLKALQNDNLPELELLVRECIQNSSDASLGLPGDRFDVNFNVGKFDPRVFNSELSCLTDILNKKFTESEYTYMEIRDSRTSGLTGPIRLSELNRDDHGNYFKLVFDTGKEQTSSSDGDAGGSWGYGKSVYYRVGIGLVIFYSQIQKDQGFEERLIVSLTEHETDDESILKEVEPKSVGRAWWGKKDHVNHELLPICDSDEIQSFLNIFGLKRFRDGQTGTSIIIPYIDENKLLDGIFPDECGVSEEEKKMSTWKDDITEYLKLAIEKWYAPKVYNKNLLNIAKQKWLAVRVNGNAIKDDGMRPFFQLVQELYNHALAANSGMKYQSAKFDNIQCVDIPSKRVTGGKAGHVAFIKITESQLSPNGGMIKPYTYLRLFGKSPKNDPIVMFARTPGMVLDYKIDGKWVKGLEKPENDDEYLIAFYVPNCGLKLKNDIALGEFAGKSLGEYLRKCEKSDHMEWDDKSKLTIVGNLKSQVVNKINNNLRANNEEHFEGTTSRLSGKLGRKLLPNIGYGAHSGGDGSSGGGGGKSENLSYDLIPYIYADRMEVEFKLNFKNNRKVANLELFIETETGVMDADSWESNIDDNFPLKIDKIESISTYSQNSKSEKKIEDICTSENPTVKSDYTLIKLLRTKSNLNICGIRIENDITNAEVSGVLSIKTLDRKYVCMIKEVKISSEDIK